MQFVEFCNLCQSAPAVGILQGHFKGDDELHQIMACEECAKASLANAK